MLRGLFTNRTALMAQQDKIDTISNNISNSSTNGYKRQDVSFLDLLQESVDRKGYPTEKNDKNKLIGTGVRTSDWYRDFSQGNLQFTGKNVDLSIKGDGFFKVTLNSGEEAYSRVANVTIDNQGEVSVSGNKLQMDFTYKIVNGKAVAPDGKDLNIQLNNFGRPFFKEDDFTINKQGEVFLKNKVGESVKVADLPIYKPTGTDGFISIGESLFKPKSGDVEVLKTNSSVFQGYSEMSNVDIGKEMVELITTQRAFDFSTKALKTVDDMWGMVNNLRGK